VGLAVVRRPDTASEQPYVEAAVRRARWVCSLKVVNKKYLCLGSAAYFPISLDYDSVGNLGLPLYAVVLPTVPFEAAALEPVLTGANGASIACPVCLLLACAQGRGDNETPGSHIVARCHSIPPHAATALGAHRRLHEVYGERFATVSAALEQVGELVYYDFMLCRGGQRPHPPV
jgi:hypothetical protein